MLNPLFKYGSRRLHNIKPAAAAASVYADTLLQDWKSQSQSRESLIRSQFLDINQLRRLNATLPFPSVFAAPATTATHKIPVPIPPCHHLVYFTPSDAEHKLGPDGSDRIFNPPGPFTRRMWAGGELEWVSGNELAVGQKVVEKTKLESAEAKRTRNGEDMLVVRVEKKFENSEGLALVDRRNWIFRRAIDPSNPLPLPPLPLRTPFPSAPYMRDITHTSVSLFRFSALTFNAHKIHYNRECCRGVEGHRDCVVHGPLNLIHMVDFWRYVIEEKEGKATGDHIGKVILPKKVTYRATSPLYVGEEYRILMDEEKEGVSEMKIVDGFGNVAMVGKIER
ncbi:b1d1322f-cf7d-438a-9e5e-c62acb6e3787 [Sclerotinia trifoliorum]|uniref:B1d1322f-cf7d-438a-9e5e-c62acb6e3787 n=1 Tax=Sclerotinia trifoliorum TaxID=28548 RepID=A0A8H2VXY1_9HELO|nr:b1d1322f-cf7d-438a-9e5e-c62acb6e3787 [Sclerotinia trifoliorum]